MMKDTISTAACIQQMQKIYDDISRAIREAKRSVEKLELKTDLSKAESRELDNMQYRLEALEDELEAVDNAICLLDIFR